jgi:hypothetical protein
MQLAETKTYAFVNPQAWLWRLNRERYEVRYEEYSPALAPRDQQAIEIIVTHPTKKISTRPELRDCGGLIRALATVVQGKLSACDSLARRGGVLRTSGRNPS